MLIQCILINNYITTEMQESIYDTSDILFEVDKDVLVFTPIQSEEFERESNITVTNISNYHIAFRIKTTKKEDYTVNPTHIVISPKAKISIDFKFLRKKHKGDLSEHKFKLDGFIISNEDKDKDAKQLFFQQEKTKARVKGNIIKMTVSFNENMPPSSSSFQDIGKSQNLLYTSATMHHSNQNTSNSNAKMDEEIIKRDRQLKEELENLKVEYYKLKNQLGTLNEKETILKNRILLENAPDSSNIKLSKHIYVISYLILSYHIVVLPPLVEKQISSTVSIALCIFTIILGFYLTY